MCPVETRRVELLPFTVDHQPQVFFDNHLIHYVQNLTRRLHRPEKQPGPLIKKDRPWEILPYFGCSNWNVLYDPQDAKFKCWYEDYNMPVWHKERFFDTCQMLAVSDDGIHWEKPALKINRINGQDTNIVMGRDNYGSVHSATIFLDQTEADPERRYKTIYRRHQRSKTNSSGRFGSEIITTDMATSPDGVHWTPIRENPIEVDTLGGDVLIANRDPITGRIILMSRAHNAGTWTTEHPDDPSFFPPYDPSEPFGFLNKRNVWRTDSADGLHWSTAVEALRQDLYDNLDDGFYGLVHFRLGELYVGILTIIHGVDDTMDLELVYSRDDGHTWHRPFRGTPYVPRGNPGQWECFFRTCCSPPINVGDQTHVYFGGGSCHHDWWMYKDMGPDVPEKNNWDMVNLGLGVATLRRDGYVSLDAGICDGVLATKPFKRGGEKLVINAACEKDGYLTAEVQDIYGRPWPGFTRADCNVFTGDDTEHTVTWQGNETLANAGRYLKLVFYMKNASIYSLRLT